MSKVSYQLCSCGVVAILLSAILPATAQQVRGGRVANSSVGEVGRRQTREATSAVLVPAGRIDGRIPSRIQSRIRSRIDRNYSPQANAASPFAVAQDQARTTVGPIRGN